PGRRLLAHAAPDGRLHDRERRAHDGARHAARTPTRAGQLLGAHSPHGGPRARLGHAAGRGGPGLLLDDELPERGCELRAHTAAPRQLLRARLVRDDLLAARPRHGAHSVGSASVRRDHGLRGALSGARRARRGGGDRRREAVAHLPRCDRPDPASGAADPHEPLDPLGLRCLYAALSADRPGAHPSGQLPDGRLSLRGGLPQDRLRAWRRNLAADAPDRRGDERRVCAPDGEDRRRRVRTRTVRRAGWHVVGLVLFGFLVFPVFWMISTAFKPDDEIISQNPTWFSGSPTLAHFRDAIDRPFFWQDVRNSLIVVTVTVAISMTLAFLAAV